MLILGLVALLIFWGVGAYNRLVRLRSAVVAAWAPIDTQLRRRQALAFELAGLLVGLEEMRDEVGRSTLQSVMAATRQAQAAVDHARARPASAGAIQSLSLAEQVLEGALRPLRVVVEARPTLFEEPTLGEPLRALFHGLQETEAQLGFVRRLFNESVRDYNQAVGELPTRAIAGLFGLRPAAPLVSASPERGPDSQLLASSFGDRS